MHTFGEQGPSKVAGSRQPVRRGRDQAVVPFDFGAFREVHRAPLASPWLTIKAGTREPTNIHSPALAGAYISLLQHPNGLPYFSLHQVNGALLGARVLLESAGLEWHPGQETVLDQDVMSTIANDLFVPKGQLTLGREGVIQTGGRREFDGPEGNGAVEFIVTPPSPDRRGFFVYLEGHHRDPSGLQSTFNIQHRQERENQNQIALSVMRGHPGHKGQYRHSIDVPPSADYARLSLEAGPNNIVSKVTSEGALSSEDAMPAVGAQVNPEALIDSVARAVFGGQKLNLVEAIRSAQ